MVLPGLVRSVAVSSAIVSALAARCGIDPHGFGAVPVTIRAASGELCKDNDADTLGKATAFYGFNATTPIAQTPSGFSITSHYAIFVDPRQSHIDLVLPEGTDVGGAASVAYFCPLLGHQLGHLQIARRETASAHGSVHVTARTLAAAEDRMRTRIAEVQSSAVASVERDQAAYDSTTQHGLAQHSAGAIDPAIGVRDMPACK